MLLLQVGECSAYESSSFLLKKRICSHEQKRGLKSFCYMKTLFFLKKIFHISLHILVSPSILHLQVKQCRTVCALVSFFSNKDYQPCSCRNHHLWLQVRNYYLVDKENVGLQDKEYVFYYLCRL